MKILLESAQTQLGLSQRELAAKLHVDQPLLSKIKNGHAALTVEQIEKLKSLLSEQGEDPT